MIDYARKRAKADRQIRKYGSLCYLRDQNGVDRECWALEVMLSPGDKRALRSLVNRVFLVTPVGLVSQPAKLDSLVVVDQATGDKLLPPLRQDGAPQPLQPQPGGIVIYWELQIVGTS